MPELDPQTPLTTRYARLEDILDLRYRILIVGTGRLVSEFPGDRDPDTLHAACYHGDVVVGCATLIVSHWENRPARQLRGMAVEVEYQKLGIGRALLEFVEQACIEEGNLILWCNARGTAVGFYERASWQLASDAFDVEGVGPHYRMVKMLRASESSPYE